MRPDPQAQDAGFTLVELLIALALLGALMGMLLTGVAGLRVSSRSTAAIKDDISPIVTYMRQALAQMHALPLDSERPGVLIDARGEAISFVTSFTPAGSYGGLAHVTWQLVPSGTPGLFLLEETRAVYRGGPAADVGKTKTVLLSGITKANFRYREVNSESPAQAEWRTGNRLPGLVALELTFQETDRRRWPPLAVYIPLARAAPR